MDKQRISLLRIQEAGPQVGWRLGTRCLQLTLRIRTDRAFSIGKLPLLSLHFLKSEKPELG
jgi:hypothetical protein